jgi:hypothetical protein
VGRAYGPDSIYACAAGGGKATRERSQDQAMHRHLGGGQAQSMQMPERLSERRSSGRYPGRLAGRPIRGPCDQGLLRRICDDRKRPAQQSATAPTIIRPIRCLGRYPRCHRVRLQNPTGHGYNEGATLEICSRSPAARARVTLDLARCLDSVKDLVDEILEEKSLQPLENPFEAIKV